MSIRVETPEDREGLVEFVLFHDRVYQRRSARWRAMLPLHMPILTGRSAFSEGRTMRPMMVRENGRIVARVLAVVDQHYICHWNEPLGHLAMFEAMPDAGPAVTALIDEACEWLRAQGMKAARAGFGMLEFPFVIDEYELLPPASSRQNPPYYHSLLKNAGFETEKGWVDYKIRVTHELIARYESMLDAARRAGFSIVAVRDVDPGRRVRDFTSTWNEAFREHWGVVPFTEREVAALFGFFAAGGTGLDTSVIAYRGDYPVGALMVTPESTRSARLEPGRMLDESEKLNFLGIAVRESARRLGVGLAMASYGYLQLVRRGAKYLSYTLVLDENRASRRTAERLGARVWANYVVYRRDFRH